jgi:hypothetical protein
MWLYLICQGRAKPISGIIQECEFAGSIASDYKIDSIGIDTLLQ